MHLGDASAELEVSTLTNRENLALLRGARKADMLSRDISRHLEQLNKLTTINRPNGI